MPSAAGGFVFPINPIKTKIVIAYGSICINCEGMSIPDIWSEISRASKKANIKQAKKIFVGFHFPIIIAARAI